jgi:putative ABC transport system permease protein
VSWISAARWVLRRALPPGDADAVLGDLLEDARDTGRHSRVFLDACSIAAHGTFRRVPPHVHPSPKGIGTMETLTVDLKYAVRSLAKRPSFPIVVLATIALGIGAATAIFSIVEAILLRPLPFHEPDRLVFANELNGATRMSFAWPNYEDYRDRAVSHEAIACHQANAFTIVGEGMPRRVDGRLVCAPFFDVLGIRMQMGRSFTAADDQPGAPPVAVISDTFWRRDLGADPAVLGRTMRTTGTPLTIVGVLPSGFTFARPEDIFVPLGITRTRGSGWDDRGNHFGLNAIARLKPDVTLSQAQAEFDRIAGDLRREYPNTNARNGGQVLLLRDRLVDDVKDTLVALMGAVGFLMLLACANVANLLVARGAARQHELAIRTALGGTRWRIVRQLLAESMLLSIGGAVIGVGVAVVLLRTLVALAPEGIPRIEGVAMNQASLWFALAAAVGCGLLFGAFPALQVSGATGRQLLARASRTSAAVSPRRSRGMLMVVEVALALILLVGCGLMARTMMRLQAVDPGFRSDHLLTARVVLAGPAWNDPAKRMTFLEQVLVKVRALPGVEGVALTLSLPIEGSNWGSVFIVRDKPVPPRPELASSAFVPVSAGYFRTMGMQLREGREFDVHDDAGAERVAVVNETFAKRMWPGESAVGKQVKQGWPETPEDRTPWRRVVGVVNDVKLNGVDQDTPMQAFLPYAQNPSRSAAIVARTSVDPASLGNSFASVIQSVDKETPVTRILPMTQLMSAAVARQRLSTVVLAVFAGVAILLAAVGLYGVVSHGVTERTREIGVRMALGAERASVLRLFVLGGIKLAAAGTIVGLVGAYLLTKWIETLLFQVTPTDPATFAIVASVLLAVAALACYIPARRAARIDPLAALRVD